MKNHALFFFTLVALACSATAQQIVVQKADDESPMQTRQMAVNARIRGLHAEVETTLVFYNPNGRILEGELVFPLPDGAVVSGYALDVGGTLVDGVVVKKEKARVAFETETRARVDPGIVEHVKGNVYRTRIYPLPSRGERTVRLRYITELASDATGDVALSLALPRETIGTLSIKVQVDSPVSSPVGGVYADSAIPEIGGFGNLRFAKSGTAWLAETTLENTTPGADIFVALPKLPRLVSAVERDADGDVFFTLSDLPSGEVEGGKVEGRRESLNIAWDASRSRATADLDRELAFLKALATQGETRFFNLIVFRDIPEAPQRFHSFDALATAIETLPYDGGTDIRALVTKLSSFGDYITYSNPAFGNLASPWFIFTDGIDTLADSATSLQPSHQRFPPPAMTAVVSQSTADREALRQLCNGSLIDLQRLDTAAAVNLALTPPKRVTGVEGSGIADVQGIGALVSGRVMLTGRLVAPTATLRIAYSDGTFSEAVTLVANAAANDNLLATVWAAGRITHLSVQPEQNEDELLALGQRYSLVSPATSLIVLESLDQYLRHEIEPPAQLAEMRRQWRANMANRPKTVAANNKLEAVVTAWQRRVAWWEGTTATPPAPNPRRVVHANTSGEPIAIAADRSHTLTFHRAAAADASPAAEAVELGLEAVDVYLDQGTAEARLDEMEHWIDADDVARHIGGFHGEVMAGSALINEGDADFFEVYESLSLSESPAVGREVAEGETVDYAAAGRSGNPPATISGGETLVRGAFAPAMPQSRTEVGRQREDTTWGSGMAHRLSAGGLSDGEMPSRSASPSASVKITAWAPDAPYLKRLKAAAPDERYAAYLEEAKTYEKSPAFFLDCADFFLSQSPGGRASSPAAAHEDVRPPSVMLGLRILSNLAEMKIEDPALLRVYAWRLQQADDFDRAIVLLRRVTRLRPEDPQSWRDLALALAERGKSSPVGDVHVHAVTDLTEAQDLFKKVILSPWNRTRDIELFALEELNALMDWIERNGDDGARGRAPSIDLDPRLRKNLDLDLRIAMSWDADATDVDLHVIEPSGEEAYYGYNLTSIRGMVTPDITDGYGPEAYLLRKAPAGHYAIRARYYGSHQQTLLGPATVTARVFTNWGRDNETSQTLTLRLDNVRQIVEIGTIKIGDNTPSWTPADLAKMKLRPGMTQDDLRALLGEPATIDENAEIGGGVKGTVWLYTSANRTWKFSFQNIHLLRAVELLPGNAEMLLVQ
ncbi:MAG: DUF2135 domain-containing protein [Kiritimatiellaeota bacterium]|nr:DUF2135 domain-containing protein [Kiritimatiellota bacterium]